MEIRDVKMSVRSKLSGLVEAAGESLPVTLLLSGLVWIEVSISIVLCVSRMTLLGLVLRLMLLLLLLRLLALWPSRSRTGIEPGGVERTLRLLCAGTDALSLANAALPTANSRTDILDTRAIRGVRLVGVLGRRTPGSSLAESRRGRRTVVLA